MKPIKANRLVGIDLGAKRSQICIIDEDNEALVNTSVHSHLPAILEVLKKHDALPAPVALEATFSWYWLADGLQDHDCDVHLVHASAFSPITKAKVKTDRRDAKSLAIMLHSGNLPEAYVYPRENRGLRDLTRQRNYTVEKNSGVLRKLRCLLYREGHFDHQLDDAKGMEPEDLPRYFNDPMVQLQAEALIAEIRSLNVIKQSVEDQLLKTVKELEDHRLLQTIPGIGKILSLVIGTEIGDILRFRSLQGFCSYCRVAPGIAQSGSSTKKGRANKAGNPHLKRSFHQAAVLACSHHPSWHAWRERILARNSGLGARMKATNAVAHRLARITFAVLRSKTPYKENHTKAP